MQKCSSRIRVTDLSMSGVVVGILERKTEAKNISQLSFRLHIPFPKNVVAESEDWGHITNVFYWWWGGEGPLCSILELINPAVSLLVGQGSEINLQIFYSLWQLFCSLSNVLSSSPRLELKLQKMECLCCFLWVGLLGRHLLLFSQTTRHIYSSEKHPNEESIITVSYRNPVLTGVMVQ